MGEIDNTLTCLAYDAERGELSSLGEAARAAHQKGCFSTRVPAPNISESHSEISTRVPFCIACTQATVGLIDPAHAAARGGGAAEVVLSDDGCFAYVSVRTTGKFNESPAAARPSPALQP